MWAGMTSDEYEIVDDGLRHKPTGIHWRWADPVQWTAPSNPNILSSETPSAFSAGLHIDDVPRGALAAQIGVPYDTWEDMTRFRRGFGNLHQLRRVVLISGVIPWGAQLIEVVATFHFISRDLAGFAKGEPAFPDKLEFVAREVPPALRQTAVNPFARHVK